ncbi:MAG: metal-dependent transcriptional regulator [Candidatus Omnitrophica bacterium]|nr:metal-dependent transcriptional regulator [Candidatus Omnitrophota bacterium]
MKIKLSATMEDYLEVIAQLKKKNTIARVRDISQLMDVKTSSVTAALMTLSRAGLVVHERYGYVTLTQGGERIAHEIQRRHDLLVRFLTNILQIDTNIAMVDACKIEHAMSAETFKKLAAFIEFVETNPEKERPQWLKHFDHYAKTGKRRVCSVKKCKEKKRK